MPLVELISTSTDPTNKLNKTKQELFLKVVSEKHTCIMSNYKQALLLRKTQSKHWSLCLPCASRLDFPKQTMKAIAVFPAFEGKKLCNFKCKKYNKKKKKPCWQWLGKTTCDSTPHTGSGTLHMVLWETWKTQMFIY